MHTNLSRGFRAHKCHDARFLRLGWQAGAEDRGGLLIKPEALTSVVYLPRSGVYLQGHVHRACGRRRQVLAGGAVEEVLGFVEGRWVRAADPSLVRYFVFGVLGAVAPPYSSYFASSLLRCAAWP